MKARILSAVVIGFRLGLVVTLVGLLSTTASGTVVYNFSGTSTIGTPVAFQADLTISGNTLTVQLFNNSPTNSLGPNDTLGSIYFDIVNNSNVRPTLTYSSAVGDVYTGDKDNPDPLFQAGANLKAVSAGDNTWQYKAMNVSTNPPYAFGIGTVGNNNLTPNNFMGNIVDGFDYSIYRDDIVTQNLNGTKLVKNTATFVFTGVSGFTEADLAPTVLFGLGTAPDSTHVGMIPEPSTTALVGLGLLGLLALRRRKK